MLAAAPAAGPMSSAVSSGAVSGSSYGRKSPPKDRAQVTTGWCRVTEDVQLRVVDGVFEYARYEGSPAAEDEWDVEPAMPWLAEMQEALPRSLRSELVRVASTFKELDAHNTRAREKAATAREIMTKMASTAEYFLQKWEELTDILRTAAPNDEARIVDAHAQREKLKDRLRQQQQDEDMLRKEAQRDKAEGDKLHKEYRAAIKRAGKNLVRALQRRRMRRLDSQPSTGSLTSSKRTLTKTLSQQLLMSPGDPGAPMVLSPASDGPQTAALHFPAGSDGAPSPSHSPRSLKSVRSQTNDAATTQGGRSVGTKRSSRNAQASSATSGSNSKLRSKQRGRIPPDDIDAGSHGSLDSETTNYTMTTIHTSASPRSARTGRSRVTSKSGQSVRSRTASRRPTEVIDDATTTGTAAGQNVLCTPEHRGRDTMVIESDDEGGQDEAGLFSGMFFNMKGVWPARRAPHVRPRDEEFDPFSHMRVGTTPCFKRSKFADRASPFYHHLTEATRAAARGTRAPVVVNCPEAAGGDGGGVASPAGSRSESVVGEGRIGIEWRGSARGQPIPSSGGSSTRSTHASGQAASPELPHHPRPGSASTSKPTTAPTRDGGGFGGAGGHTPTPSARSEESQATSSRPDAPGEVPHSPSTLGLSRTETERTTERGGGGVANGGHSRVPSMNRIPGTYGARPFSAGAHPANHAIRPFSAGSLRSCGSETIMSLSSMESSSSPRTHGARSLGGGGSGHGTPPKHYRNLWYDIDGVRSRAPQSSVGGDSSPIPGSSTVLSPLTTLEMSGSDHTTFTSGDDATVSSPTPPPSGPLHPAAAPAVVAVQQSAPVALQRVRSQQPLGRGLMADGAPRRRSTQDPRPLPEFQMSLKTSLQDVIVENRGSPTPPPQATPSAPTTLPPSPKNTCWRELRVLRNVQRSPAPAAKSESSSPARSPAQQYMRAGRQHSPQPFSLSPPPDALKIGFHPRRTGAASGSPASMRGGVPVGGVPSPQPSGSPTLRTAISPDVVGWGYDAAGTRDADTLRPLPLSEYPLVMSAGREQLVKDARDAREHTAATSTTPRVGLLGKARGEGPSQPTPTPTNGSTAARGGARKRIVMHVPDAHGHGHHHSGRFAGSPDGSESQVSVFLDDGGVGVGEAKSVHKHSRHAPPRKRLRYSFRTAPAVAMQTLSLSQNAAMQQACEAIDADADGDDFSSPRSSGKPPSSGEKSWPPSAMHGWAAHGGRPSRDSRVDILSGHASSSTSQTQTHSGSRPSTRHTSARASGSAGRYFQQAARRRPHAACVTVIDAAKRGTGVFRRHGAEAHAAKDAIEYTAAGGRRGGGSARLKRGSRGPATDVGDLASSRAAMSVSLPFHGGSLPGRPGGVGGGPPVEQSGSTGPSPMSPYGATTSTARGGSPSRQRPAITGTLHKGLACLLPSSPRGGGSSGEAEEAQEQNEDSERVAAFAATASTVLSPDLAPIAVPRVARPPAASGRAHPWHGMEAPWARRPQRGNILTVVLT